VEPSTTTVQGGAHQSEKGFAVQESPLPPSGTNPHVEQTWRAQSHERDSQLIRAIVHDLRNPLTAVKLNAQLIEQAALRDGREKEQRWASLIVSATHRLDGLLQQLSDSERIRSGRIQLQKQPLTFNQLLNEQLAGESLDLDNDPINLVLPKEPLVVLADRARLGQALRNLLSLALQEASPASTVKVHVCNNDGKVTCTILVPKPPETSTNQPLVPEARSPMVADLDGYRNGLTLYVARTLIESHGGQLITADDGGCALAFQIIFPAGQG
jgi:signal transduction histidine kinase